MGSGPHLDLSPGQQVIACLEHLARVPTARREGWVVLSSATCVTSVSRQLEAKLAQQLIHQRRCNAEGGLDP